MRLFRMKKKIKNGRKNKGFIGSNEKKENKMKGVYRLRVICVG